MKFIDYEVLHKVSTVQVSDTTMLLEIQIACTRISYSRFIIHHLTYFTSLALNSGDITVLKISSTVHPRLKSFTGLLNLVT
jgi:hypothetical protein